MAVERRALLVATDNYTDPGLLHLRAPTGDARALGEVLADPTVGGFDVRPLINQPTEDVKVEIEGFFTEASREQLLLLYVTGHGVLSPTRKLFFATTNTRLDRLRTTAVEDRFVGDLMDDSRARRIVLILDCCHSGAFVRGHRPKGANRVDVEQRFEGRGHLTLTASTELEYAFEETQPEETIDELGVAAPGSLFTRYLVEGLRTGEADLNQDGRVTANELYAYAFDRVRDTSRAQTPGRSGAGHGDIAIARNPHHQEAADGGAGAAAAADAGAVHPSRTDAGAAQYMRLMLVVSVLIGFFAIALPSALVMIDGVLLDGRPFPRASLSAYYYSGARELFVAPLSVMGACLVVYKIVETNLDNTLSLLAGVSALIAALVPAGRASGPGDLTPLQGVLGESFVSGIHFTAMTTFFASLAAISYFFGTRQGMRAPRGGSRSPRFWRAFHWTCAGTICAALAWTAVTAAADWGPSSSVLIGEAVAMWAFGVSWLWNGLEFDLITLQRRGGV